MAGLDIADSQPPEITPNYMKLFNAFVWLPAAILLFALPSGRSHSQLAPVTDPTAELQNMDTANEDLLKRQDATLKDLTEMTDTANEVRLFSHRN